MQVISIKNKSKEKIFTDYRKNVEKCPTLTKSMVKTDLQNRIKPTIPDKPFREDLTVIAIKRKCYRDWYGNFFYHHLFVVRIKSEVKWQSYRILRETQVIVTKSLKPIVNVFFTILLYN